MTQINPVVKEYVSKNNVRVVKSTLARLAYVVGFFKSFKDSTEYASASLGDIFDEDDGAEFNKEKTLSNYKHIVELMMDNFSRRKYEAVIEIGSVIFADQGVEKVENKTQEREKPPFGQAPGNRYKRLKKLCMWWKKLCMWLKKLFK